MPDNPKNYSSVHFILLFLVDSAEKKWELVDI